MEDFIFSEAAQNLDRVSAPAVLITNAGGESPEPPPLPFEPGFRTRAAAKGLFLIKFSEQVDEGYLHNWMLSRVPELPFEQLVACRAGEWERTFGKTPKRGA